jgi:hypothetical protein
MNNIRGYIRGLKISQNMRQQGLWKITNGGSDDEADP